MDGMTLDVCECVCDLLSLLRCRKGIEQQYQQLRIASLTQKHSISLINFLFPVREGRLEKVTLVFVSNTVANVRCILLYLCVNVNRHEYQFEHGIAALVVSYRNRKGKVTGAPLNKYRQKLRRDSHTHYSGNELRSDRLCMLLMLLLFEALFAVRVRQVKFLDDRRERTLSEFAITLTYLVL